MKGINGKILKVDLTNQEYSVDEPDDIFYRKYVGGRGFALYYMHKEMAPGIDPLGPGNMLVFASSIIGGAPGPAIPRLMVCAKSPLTGGFGESEAGGYWAPELKRAGFDAVIVTGKAESPVYLWIEDGEVEFKDASHLWGKVTGEVQDILEEELQDDQIKIAQIGPGGENQVLYANITNQLGHFNGRTGMGAVMGSKNLKAIAVRGTGRVDMDDGDKVKEISRWTAAEGMKNPLAKTLREIGTPSTLNANNESGALPTRNWNKGVFDNADKISGETMKETIGKKSQGCFACPIRCKRVVEVDEDDIKVDPRYGGPEYETLASFSSLLDSDDLKIAAKANELCNKYTIDTVSTGMTIAFAMECYENGLLTKEDCDGLELKFGNKEVITELVNKIASREGIGDLLAEGSYRAAQEIGQGAEKYTRQVKGQEVPMHDPRVKTGVGLQYALADYGADHMKAAHDTFYRDQDTYGTKTTKALGIYDAVDPLDIGKEKVNLFVKLDTYWSMLDMLGVCHFGYAPRGPIPVKMLMELVQAITGTDISLYELMEAGERSTTMARLFNLREGITAEADKLPDKFFEDFADGPLAGTGGIDREQFKEAVKMRYRMMGWDESGCPQTAKQVELGVDWIEFG